MNESAFHPEDVARSAIDRRLALCGWVVQSRADMNLGAGLGVAIREFQTASGPVDYALFVGRRLCGVIEAKISPGGRPRARVSVCTTTGHGSGGTRSRHSWNSFT